MHRNHKPEGDYNSEVEMPSDSDDVEDPLELAAWKVRELEVNAP